MCTREATISRELHQSPQRFRYVASVIQPTITRYSAYGYHFANTDQKGQPAPPARHPRTAGRRQRRAGYQRADVLCHGVGYARKTITERPGLPHSPTTRFVAGAGTGDRSRRYQQAEHKGSTGVHIADTRSKISARRSRSAAHAAAPYRAATVGDPDSRTGAASSGNGNTRPRAMMRCST